MNESKSRGLDVRGAMFCKQSPTPVTKVNLAGTCNSSIYPDCHHTFEVWLISLRYDTSTKGIAFDILKNRLLVTDEMVEFKGKNPVAIRDFRKIDHHSRGIWGIYPI
jgi:hypothetical protein